MRREGAEEPEKVLRDEENKKRDSVSLSFCLAGSGMLTVSAPPGPKHRYGGVNTFNEG